MSSISTGDGVIHQCKQSERHEQQAGNRRAAASKEAIRCPACDQRARDAAKWQNRILEGLLKNTGSHGRVGVNFLTYVNQVGQTPIKESVTCRI